MISFQDVFMLMLFFAAFVFWGKWRNARIRNRALTKKNERQSEMLAENEIMLVAIKAALDFGNQKKIDEDIRESRKINRVSPIAWEVTAQWDGELKQVKDVDNGEKKK